MSSEAVVTHNEATNRRPRWGVGSPYENEPASLEYHLKSRIYWVDSPLGGQSAQSYQVGTPAERVYSTAEGRMSIGHRFTGCILCCTLSDPVDPPLEAGDPTVLFSQANLEKLLTLSGSYQNAVTIRTSDGGTLVIKRKMADIAPAYLPSEPEMHAEAQLHPATQLFSKGFVGVRPSASAMYSVLSDPADSPPETMATAQASQVEAGRLSTITGSLRNDLMQMPGGSALVFTRKMADVAPAYMPGEPAAHVEDPLHPIVQSFASGFEGMRPSVSTVESARMIVEAAMERAVQKEIEVDDTDGSLTFELRLTNGLLVIGELSLDDHIQANVYNDRHPNACAGIEDIWVEHLPQTTAADLIALF